ncbi:MAG TPA: rod shape-determining protein MreD [Gammaproteobacteria bacterium]|nr:rod shape-determining protein MreD [Gammaproteobacteria bacterium]
MRKLSFALTIVLSLLAAFILTIVPWPLWAEPLRPLWVALTVFYWIVALPERLGVVFAWIVGLFLDVLTGTVLGAHALALSLVAFIAARSHLKFRMYPLWQQSLTVGLALALYAFVLFWIGGLTGAMTLPVVRFVPVAVSMLLWPCVYLSLRALRRRFVPA